MTLTASTGVTFVRGLGSHVTRPQLFEATYAETGTGKSASVDLVVDYTTAISRVIQEVLPFCLGTILEDADVPQGFDSRFIGSISLDATRIPSTITATTWQGATLSLLAGPSFLTGASELHTPKKLKVVPAIQQSSTQCSNIIVVYDEAKAFESCFANKAEAVAQLEQLCVQLLYSKYFNSTFNHCHILGVTVHLY